MTAWFVSDLHLARAAGPTFERFCRFLDGGPNAGDSVHVLGDLFDAWIGDDDLPAADNAAIVAPLGACARRGVALRWIAGNRDFLAGPDFLRASGMRAEQEVAVLDLFGVPTAVCHGDHLCTDDVDYQAFRAEARGARWRDAFLARPRDERRVLVSGMRSRSEREKAAKAAAIMDVNAAAVEALFRATGATRLIHGHTHRPGRHDLVVDGRAVERWVLPAWEESPGGVAVDAGGARFVDFT